MHAWILLHVCLFSPIGIIITNAHILSVSWQLKQSHFSYENATLCSWYYCYFGSSHNQLIMLHLQATLMILLPELWIYMLCPLLLLHHIDYIVSTAVFNFCISYAASTCCGYMLHSLAVNICVIHLLWKYCCYSCGYPKTTTVVFCLLLWICAANITANGRTVIQLRPHTLSVRGGDAAIAVDVIQHP